MFRRRFLSFFVIFGASLLLTVSCAQGPSPEQADTVPADQPPLVIGYSNWAGWWPWAIAEEEGLFAKNGLNVRMQWFDGYLESMQALAAGQLDGNSQTLNDTISFAGEAINGEVAVLVNDNSAGNDKIIVAPGIETIQDLKGKTVAIEEGVVDDFLLSLALEEAGMSRNDVIIKPLETGAAAAAFAAGQADAVGAFPPFWLTALQREGSKALITSAEFPGAIPDLLVVTEKLIEEKPEQVQALVKTWFDIREFMEQNPERSDEIMARRAGVSPEELQLFKEGTRFLTLEENVEAFSPGDNMKHMPYAAERMADFMINVGFIDQKPDLDKILDGQFVNRLAEST